MLINFNYVLIYGSTNVFVLFHQGWRGGVAVVHAHVRVCATILFGGFIHITLIYSL